MGGGQQTVDDVLAWVWNQQSVWSQGADNLKKSLFNKRTMVLWLTVLASILATLGVQIAEVWPLWGRGLAGAAAAAVGLVTLVSQGTTRKHVQTWTRARSVSEGLKGEVFMFLAGVAPYRGADRAEALKAAADKIISEAHEATRCTIAITPISRALPVVADVDTYVSWRIRPQIENYYRPQSQAMQRLADRYRCAINALAVLALLLTSISALTGWQHFAGWAPVATTVIAAVAAHGAVNRYDAIALEYARTAQQLERLLLERPSETGPHRQSDDDRFVAEAEAVISLQNESWMVRSLAAVVDTQGNAGQESSTDQPHA